MRDDDSRLEIQEVVSNLQRLSLNTQRRDPIYEQKRNVVTAEDVSKWFTVEASESTQMGNVEDAIAVQNFNSGAPFHSSSGLDSVRLNQTLSLLRVHEIYGMFQDLESTVISCHVPGALLHLRGARRAFSDTKRD